MKTTLDLDDDLMRAVRERARREGVTITELISDALRRALTGRPPAESRLELPVTRGTRMPAVDVDRNTALDDYLDRSDRQSMS